MPVNAPEPRIPLEPEEYPLYRPQSRIGCSGLSIVTIATILVFGVLYLQVAPRIVEGISGFNPLSAITGDQSTPGASTITGAMATQTTTAAEGLPTETPVAIVTPTPERSCVKVAATGGLGVALREQAKSDGKRIVSVAEGATLEVIGEDVTSGKDTAGKDIVWRNVRLLPPDGRSGYALGKFLETVPCP